LGIKQPDAGTGYSFEEVKTIADRIGYPVLIRPSYVLGGRAMEIVFNEIELEDYMRSAVKVSKRHPILIDKYLSHAIEIDVDAVCDGKDVFIGGIMEHIEEAGVHSGDATMVLPTRSLDNDILERIRDITRRTAIALGTKGLINLQLAVRDGEVFMLEANPRASRTIPFISKAIGIPLAKVATKIMLGRSLADQDLRGEARIDHYAVKASVFPFLKLPGVDSILGPEMKSTGEVMGIDGKYGAAMWKAMSGAGMELPMEGEVYISVRDLDKAAAGTLAKDLVDLGLRIIATKGTAAAIREAGVPVETVFRIAEKTPPDALTLMRRGRVKMIINTPTESSGARRDGYMMRRLAVELQIPFFTTIEGARAAVEAIQHAKSQKIEPVDLASIAKSSR